MKIIISTFTDESGQDTKGRLFVVSTVILLAGKSQNIETRLLEIEKESKKIKKWTDVANKRRISYTKLLLKKKIFSDVTIYFSVYKNKLDYEALIGSHIAKAILDYVEGERYLAKIFIDRMNKSSIVKIKKEIKLLHVRYRKIRQINDKSSSLIRLADSICGLVRDLSNKNLDQSYKTIANKIKEI